MGSFLVSVGVAVGRLAWERPGLFPWVPLGSILSTLLIAMGSASWLLYIFSIDYEDGEGEELLRAFLVFLLLSYLIFDLLG